MPLAKSAEKEQAEIRITNNNQAAAKSNLSSLGWESVPLDIFRYFSVDIGSADNRAIDKIKGIYEWAKEETQNLGEIISKITSLENKLGKPALDERRYDKVWFYTQMNKKMNYYKKLRNSVKDKGR